MMKLILIAIVLLVAVDGFKISPFKLTKKNFAPLIVSIGLLGISPDVSNAIAQQYKLPPIDRKDPDRCLLSTSNMGQANAARDKLFDLRECDLKGQVGAVSYC